MTEPTTQTPTLSVPMAIIVAGLAIAAAIYFSGAPASTEPKNPKRLATELSADDHYIGNLNGKVVIVEYSDTECPFCKVFHATMNQIMAEYGKDGNVAWVYRHFPIASLHSKAAKEAEATECANKLGGNQKFWEYINRLFAATPSNDGLELSELYTIAAATGIDKDAFSQCLDSGEMASVVNASIEDGIKMGVPGTPRSFIVVNGKVVDVISGANPYDAVKTQIDAALKR